jgi:sec-independent protein translocase protein TatA
MIGSLFDSPWKVLILAVVILVMFGSKKLPAAARSLGQSMRILKTEIKDLRDEETPLEGTGGTVNTAVVPQAQPAPVPQHQVEQLQQQIDELRMQSQAAEVQQTHQVG